LLCQFQLKWCFQNRQWLLSTWYSPLQLMYLNEWVYSFPFSVLSLEGFILKFALQHHTIFLWCFSLCRLSHFWHFNLYRQHVYMVWPYFQQFLHCRILGFMFVPLIVVMWCSILKHLLIRSFAFVPFWKFQMSTYTMAMLDLGEALIMQE